MTTPIRRRQGSLGALLVALAGCSSVPIAYHAYAPIPVQSPSVEVVVREVHRGRAGGFVSLQVTNLSEDMLETIRTSDVILQADGGPAMHGLGLVEFQSLIEKHGPASMGVKSADPAVVPVALDPVGANVRLARGDRAVLHVAFQSPDDTKRLTIDLSPAMYWRKPSGNFAKDETPLVVAVELPHVPPGKESPIDRWSKNVHFGVMLSSDAF